MLRHKILIGCLFLIMQPNFSVQAQIWGEQWGVLLFKGQTARSNLDDIGLINYTEKHDLGEAIDLEYPNTDEIVYGVEVSREVSQQNFLFQFIEPIVSRVELAFNVLYRESNTKTIGEIAPAIIFRWMDFSWDQYLKTTFALAEGWSYTSNIPDQEFTEDRASKHFLNLLNFEVTFALPRYPEYETVFRIHHRSAGYGLYGTRNTSSNALGVGFRLRFDH